MEVRVFRAKQAAVDAAKRITSDRTRSRAKLTYVAARANLAPALGGLPDFMVIGAMRGGTSSLFKYLDSHPQTRASTRKEVHYFTRDFDRGEAWYRAHFGAAGRRRNFEATPAYLAFKPAAVRAADLIPDTRLVILLRDPVARARSHHAHMVALGRERLPFEEAIQREPSRVAEPVADAERGIFHPGIGHHTYITRSLYGQQLAWWLEEFPVEQFWLGSSESFYADPPGSLASISRHVGVDPAKFVETDRNYSRPKAPSDDLPAQTRLPGWAQDALSVDHILLRKLLVEQLQVKDLPSWLM